MNSTINQINTYDNFKEWDEIFRKEGLSYKDTVQAAILDLLDYLGINSESYPQYLEKENDFWNDQNEAGHYFCDLISEWADRQVDIYYYDIWQNAGKFSGFEDDLISNYGGDCIAKIVQDGGIPKLLQAIQYEAYYQFACTVCDLIRKEP